ncbi:MAG: hypothetical protein NTZ25_04065 [Candidatus Peregrinibacteria bacterium]|nr:hypothetical protein [Candidatus Peregrinibacteria bacterium]
MDNLTQNSTPTPENNGNSRKKVLIGTLALVLLLSGTYFLGSGTGTQGSINNRKVPAKTEIRATEQRETPPATTGVLRGKPTQTTTTTTTTTAPATTPTQTTPPPTQTTPAQTPPPVAATFDASTMDISRQWQGEAKYSNVIFYNDSTNGVQFNIKLPTYTGQDYGAVAHLQICKNSNCSDIKTLAVQTMSMIDRTIMVSKEEVNSAVKAAGISNNDQGTIQYSINDNTGKTLTSKSLAYTFYDYNAAPAVAAGQTLFDKNTMSLSYTSVAAGGGYSSSGTQVFYDKNVKNSLSIQFNTPTYNLDAAPNTKTSYIAEITAQVCNADGTQCQNLTTDTKTIFNKDQKFQTDADTYRKYVYTIPNDTLITEVKDHLTNNGGNPTYIFTIKDPTGTTLTTNSLTLVISDKDKAAIMAPPIVGNIFDETTFTMKVEYPQLTDNQITYSVSNTQPITFKYKLPNIKVGATQTQYLATATLIFCDDAKSSCTDLKSFESYVFNTDNQTKQMIFMKADFDSLIASNPDKTTFAYKLTDPSGSTFFSANSFKLIKQ